MGEVKFRKADYAVREISHAEAKDLVLRHHYAKGGSNTGTHFFGLFRQDSDECLGVAWYLPPTPNAAKATWDGDWKKVLALTRFVLVPGLPTNAASFLLGASIRAIREEGVWDCLVTYADQGQGHRGTIYKATNWEFMGEVGPYTNWLDADGRQVSAKRGPTNLAAEELRSRGYTKVRTKKFKFRFVL
jgi:hypothetical protein